MNFKMVPIVGKGKVIDERIARELKSWIDLMITADREAKFANYTERLDLEGHLAFDALLTPEGDWVGFSGLYNGGRYPEGCYRVLNRCFTAPKYRRSTRGTPGLHTDLIAPSQIEQNREKLSFVYFSIEEPHRRRIVETLADRMRFTTGLDWRVHPLLNQVAPCHKKSCFQWVAYAELRETPWPFQSIDLSEYQKLED